MIAGTKLGNADSVGNFLGGERQCEFSGHVTLAAIAAALLALPATPMAQAKLEGRTVKIGCLAPLTGKGAEWGQAAKPSMEIAAEEINAKGGIGGVPIELICYDTQTLEAEALKAMSRLVDRDKVLVISGPCFSGEFETIAPQLDSRFKTVINSYCSAKPGLSAMSKWAFRNTLTSDKQLKPVVEAWVNEYKPKKVVIIYDAEDAVSKGEGAGVLPALFKQHDIEVLEQLTYRTKDTDYSAQVTKAKSLGAEGHRARLLLPERRRDRQGDGEAGPQRADRRRRLRGRAGLHRDRRQGGGRRLHVDRRLDRRSARRGAGLCEEDRRQAERPACRPTAARAPTTSSTPTSTASRSPASTNKPSDIDSDRDKIRDCLGGLKGFPGVAGEITMDEVRDGAGSSAILKVVNGKYVNMAKPATN